MTAISLRSPDVDDGAVVPDRHAHHHDNISPSLEWVGVPAEATELLLLCEDPDAPGGNYLHWLVTGIDPHSAGVPEHSVPQGGQEWPNDFGEVGWGGPEPPVGHGLHHYVFQLYALSGPVELSPRPSVDEIYRAAEAVALARATLVGTYER